MAARTEEPKHPVSEGDGRSSGSVRNLLLSGLTLRLLGALMLVVVVAVTSLWLVDTFLESQIFAEDPASDSVTADPHNAEAFRSANTIAGVVAILVAFLIAVALSVLLARRVHRLVRGVAVAAATIASGDFAARVTSPQLGRDVDDLVDGFNLMADQLQTVEQRRRRLLGDLAHELRTPIATLDAYLEGIEDGIAELDDQSMEVLWAQTRRLARLADDIAHVSRAEENLLLELGEVSLAQVVTTTVLAASPVAKTRGVALRQRIERGVPAVRGDRERLEQVLTNLLGNALRHTPAGGTVTVRLRREGQAVRVDVQDTGEGIRPEDLEMVTTRFYRGASVRGHSEGSGVGLTIARAIVRGHDGELRVHSDGPDAGATVSFWLPC